MKLTRYIRNKLKQKHTGLAATIIGIFLLLFIIVFYIVSMQGFINRAMLTEIEDSLVASNLASEIIDLDTYRRTRNVAIKPVNLTVSKYNIYKEVLSGNLQMDAGGEFGHVSGMEYAGKKSGGLWAADGSIDAGGVPRYAQINYFIIYNIHTAPYSDADNKGDIDVYVYGKNAGSFNINSYTNCSVEQRVGSAYYGSSYKGTVIGCSLDETAGLNGLLTPAAKTSNQKVVAKTGVFSSVTIPVKLMYLGIFRPIEGSYVNAEVSQYTEVKSDKTLIVHPTLDYETY